jgi:hypothetical protein
MPEYSGSFQYLDERGSAIEGGACGLAFEAETCSVTPASSDALAFDLGDVDAFAAGEWELSLRLFNGRSLALRKFGPAFGKMQQELQAAWRDRTVQCLLLEDLEEVGRWNGAVAGTPAEIRLFGSNLAVLPVSGMPLQWRLAEVDAVSFDEAAYTVTLHSAGERLAISKLARKTDEFRGALDGALAKLRQQSADALHGVFPMLDQDQLRRVLAVMPEGRSAPLAALRKIDAKLPDALVEHAVDARLRPYFDALHGRAAADSLLAGFKFSRAEAEPEAAPEDEAAEPGPDEPLFFWFFFPLGNTIAWEASTGAGRATYFFRVPQAGNIEATVASLTRGLALVNFRREPVYLPDESLERQPRFRRYAIGCRKLPDLRSLRQAYIGRAIHSSLEKWTVQVDAV